MGANSSRHETYNSNNKCDCCGNRHWAQFDRDPFAQGAFRLAFKGTYGGSGSHCGKPCVTKVIKRNVSPNFSEYLPDLAASVEAQILAKCFNERHRTNRPIEFVVPLIAKTSVVGQTGGWFWSTEDKRYVTSQSYVAIEPFIAGNYKKFNSNSGVECELTQSLAAFSHFTYAESEGKLLVCDLQGVRSNNRYVLTDPAICSRDQIYGKPDLGAAGMASFFVRHHCTSICEDMPMPEVDNAIMIRELNPLKRTSYTFELDAQQQVANEVFRNRIDLPKITGSTLNSGELLEL